MSEVISLLNFITMTPVINMEPAWIKLHTALHDPKEPKVIQINGIWLKIQVHFNGCRFAVYDGTRIMCQNPKKSTVYAERARNGEKLSWVMFTKKPWELVATQPEYS